VPEGRGGCDAGASEGRGGCEAGTTEGRVAPAAGGDTLDLADGGPTDFPAGSVGGLLAGGAGNPVLCMGGGSAAGCPFCAFAMIRLPRWTAWRGGATRSLPPPAAAAVAAALRTVQSQYRPIRLRVRCRRVEGATRTLGHANTHPGAQGVSRERTRRKLCATVSTRGPTQLGAGDVGRGRGCRSELQRPRARHHE
jgi:hypothetical protein